MAGYFLTPNTGSIEDAAGYGEVAVLRSRDARKCGSLVANRFELYQGTHTSKVAERFQNHVLPFFSQSLCFDSSCR